MKKRSMADAVKVFGQEKAGEAPKRKDMPMLNVRLPRELIKALKVWTVQNDTNMNRFVEELLEKELKQRGAI